MDYKNVCFISRLFTFPTKKKNPETRERWKQVVGRQDGNKLWSPPKDSRVCSKHFVDSQPTSENPLPTLQMGYDGAEKRVKRMIQFESTRHRPSKKKFYVQVISSDCAEAAGGPRPFEDPEMETLSNEPESMPWIFTILTVLVCLFMFVQKQNDKIVQLKAEVQMLRQKVAKLKNTLYAEVILKTDEDVVFFTGLQSKSVFNKLHSFIAPYVNRRWTGVVSMVRNVRIFKNKSRFGPERKMTSKSEFLMTFMKLRLGLLNKDLAKRFDISETLCSRIFFAWLRASCAVLKSLIYMPDEESLIASKPERFRKLPDLHSIIDCTEIFIETPKDLYLQSATWSDYKHHNTLKVLIACTPNSSINFVSKAYLGRVSDKALTLDCGYLDQLPVNCMLMADKGFNIADDCATRHITLYVPPGKRGHSQMSSACVEKTKRIANHRILIEQVIRRLKTFRILANEIPISLVEHVDEIVCVCSAICNMKKPIYKT